MALRALIVDILAHGKGKRLWTRDVIGSGPRSIGGVLERRGIPVDLASGELILERRELMREYDVLLISGMVSDYPLAKRVIGFWRKIRGRRPIISGGPFSEYGAKLLKEGVDLIVVGEGEATLDELTRTAVFDEGAVSREELMRIKGIVFEWNGKAIYTGPRPPLSSEELGKFRPSCRLAEHYIGYWSLRFYIETVRGCSNFVISPYATEVNRRFPGCAYCSVPSYWGPARSVPLDRIVDDIRCLLDVGVNRFVLSGPDVLDYGRDWTSPNRRFAVNPFEPPPNIDALRALFSSVIEKTGLSIDKGSVIVENVKPVTVTEETAKLLGEYFKGTPVNIGIESGDDNLLRRMGRPGNIERALKAIKLLRENGLLPQAYFIYGLPEQDDESLRKTLDLLPEVVRAGADRIILYRFIPLARTPLEDASRRPTLSPLEKLLEKRVRAINRYLKKRLYGRKIKAVIAGKRDGYLVAYPLSHGPVVFIPYVPRIEKNPVGRVAKLKITGIYKDRVVEGEIISLGKRVSKPSYWEKVLYKNG